MPKIEILSTPCSGFDLIEGCSLARCLEKIAAVTAPVSLSSELSLEFFSFNAAMACHGILSR
ncbi:MAG: hypothetical protein K0S08_2176 [Gammaproteobacteria bacterium]|nr:hypothetical protein [Gammaproteobacteria bacterium]